ncbi:PREDICTED: uncharacterized protein LOC106816407 [Priapulus caudatus]|uniref:Uncharacterized protein LOC106816407 n=1 Tax=Priapulus caudatus TaxID=37621 RepID=A0ABM1EWC5_PRICU|nr:PREDICTED: uncharacterized protein LOC106816407 [Priapulus caudatus]
MLVCDECCVEVELLVECECCNTWLCLACGKISNKVWTMLQHYNAISFYCKACQPVVKQCIDKRSNSSSKDDTQRPDITTCLEKKLMGIVASVEEKVNELMSFKDKLTQENDKVTKTYASIVKNLSETKNPVAATPAPTNDRQNPINIIDEYNDRERRKNNLIVTGIEESKSLDPNMRKEDDNKVIKKIMETLKVNDVVITKTIRLGAKKDPGDKPRLLLVALDDNKKKRVILSHAKELRELEEWNTVYISPDLTRKEQEEGKKLREQLRLLREQGHNDYIIRRGMIVKDPKKAVENTTRKPIAQAKEVGSK